MNAYSNKYDPEPNGKPILCLDFDGCIHSYSSGWKGVDKIPDTPVPGVFEWIESALEYFEIHVYSSRSTSAQGRAAMYFYIRNHAPHLAGKLFFAKEKPRAFIQIDDRCIMFDVNWSKISPKELLNFKPWYKR